VLNIKIMVFTYKERLGFGLGFRVSVRVSVRISDRVRVSIFERLMWQ